METVLFSSEQPLLFRFVTNIVQSAKITFFIKKKILKFLHTVRPSSYCNKTGPIPTSEASVCNTKALLTFGNFRIGVSMSDDFRIMKAFS